MAVGEGTYSRNYDIEVRLYGWDAEVAWHVQDSQNSYRRAHRNNPWYEEIWVCCEVNGQLRPLRYATYWPYYNYDGGHLHIKVAGGVHEIEVAKRLVDEVFTASVTPTYDVAGNMTFEGVDVYGYDAWNRLVRVSLLLHACIVTLPADGNQIGLS